MKIDKLGIELEGEFIKDPAEYDIYSKMPDWTRTSDGSICGCRKGYAKELVSKPFYFGDLNKALKQLEVLENDDKKIAFPNTSCGTHIHISFKTDVEYCKATQFRVYNKFIEAYKKAFEMPKYADRLAKTDMCVQFQDYKDYLLTVSDQLTTDDKMGARYKVFNFCKKLHGTLEIRIFPYLTTIEGLKNVVEFVYNFFNDIKVPDYSPLENILKWDKLALDKMSVAGAMLQSFTNRYTRARNKMYFDTKCLPFDLIKFIYHTTPITLHKDD